MFIFKICLLPVLALLLALSPYASAVNVLIVGNTQASHTGNTSTNSAFNPTQVKNNLQTLLTAAGHSNVNVVLENRGDENGGSTNSGNLGTWFSYPYPANIETTDRWPNLRGEKGTVWDYIVLIPDPFTIERIPGYYTHGVAKISEEVAKSTNPAEIVLLMTWPNDDRNISSLAHYKEVVYRTGRSGGFKVAPAGLAWQAAGSPRDSNYPSANGAYIAAASIYSSIYNQSANSGNNLANIAQSTFTANNNAVHYTGKFNFNNPFMMLGDKRRKIFTSDKGSSTERGYENNTIEAANRCLVDGDPNTYGGKYNSSTPEDDGLGWNMSNPMPIALNLGRYGGGSKSYVVNPNYWQLGIAFNYQSNYHSDPDLDIGQMQNDISLASTLLGQLPSGRSVPARSLYAWMNQYHPTLLQTGGGEHVTGDVLGSYGTFIYTMYSGRCSVDALQGSTGDEDYTGQNLGYQMAWHLGRCEVRAPGFKVMPSGKYKLSLAPDTTETMSVQFLYPPRETVTVNVSIPNADAATVSPQTLVFTPSNYNVAQNVTVTGLPGINDEDAFTVEFNSSSDDEPYDALHDSWAYTTTRSNTVNLSRVDLGTSNVSAFKNEPVSIQLGVTGANASNTTVTAPFHGAIQWSGSNLIYTPTNNYVGLDAIAYHVNLNGVLTTAYVQINIQNSLPEATRVSVVATDPNAAEAGTDPGTWTISRTGGTSALTVNFTIGGTATEGTDYNNVGSSITIPAGQSSVNITITPNNDSILNEIGETAELTINPGSGYTPIAGTAVIVIEEDDISPPPAIVLDSPGNDSVNIPSDVGLLLETTVTSYGPPASVAWTLVSGPGAAIFESANSDDTAVTFTQDGEYILRLTADDSIVQSSLDVTVKVGVAAQVGMWYGKVTGAQNWTTPNPQTTLLPDPSVETENGYHNGEGIGSKTTEVLTGRIFDADGVISFTEDSDEYVRIWVGGNLVLSDNGASTRTHSGTLNVTPGWNDFEVRVGNQWSFSGRVTAPGIGVDSNGGTNYQLLTDPGNGSFLRVDTNNIGPVVNAGIDHVAAVGASINLDATVSDENLPIPTSLTTTWVKVHGPGNANFANPAAVDTTVSCNASGIYIVRLVADDGEIKTFSDSFLTVGSVSVPQVSVTAIDPNASEVGPNGGSWTITRNGSTSSALEVRFSFGGTASFNTDYTTSEAGVIQIPAGQSSVTINLTPVPDGELEGTETAILNLTPRAFYAIGNGAASIEISEPDSVELTTPNGGESFFVGAPNNIDWISLSGGNVKIELFKNGTLHSEIATSTPNDGSYSWTIPESLSMGNDYRVRVSLLNGSGTNDTSDTYFSITSDPLATALDATQLIWSTSGNASWFPQSTTTHDGVDAAESGNIGDSQESVMETTVTGPGTLTFWWKVSSEGNYDWLRFFLNGVEQTGSLAKISGNVDWVQKTLSLPAGTHVIKWTYSKDGSVSSNADTAWIDQVVFTPDSADYTITFNKQGGTGGSNSVIATQNEAMPSATAPTRSGYNFSGYFSGTNGSGSQYYTSTMASANNWDIASNTTLYAHWIENYTTWSGSTPFGSDNNNDGVSNGIAWLLGAPDPSTNATALLPALNESGGNLILTFSCLKSSHRGSGSLKLQASDDLGASNPWANTESEIPDVSSVVNGISFIISPHPDPSLINVQATISGGSSSQMFARLRGATAP